MKLAVIQKVNNGCSYYRCELPTKYLPLTSKDELEVFYADREAVKYNYKSLKQLETFSPDIIFWNGVPNGESVESMLKYKSYGAKLVMDVDDYWELSRDHYMYDFWYKNGYNLIFQKFIQLADIVFTTNDYLRSKILPLNKNCIIIPNAVPFGEGFFVNNKIQLDKFNFLYAGGATHYKDVALFKNKFDRLGGDKFIKDHAMFTLAGYNPLPSKHCEWDKMASVFSRTNTYKIIDTLPVGQHMSIYDSANVALIPLVNNEFNRSKSFLKVIEAATRELPCIVSNTLPYSELKGYPGIFWENWLENIKFSIKNPTFVQDQGKELAEKIKANYDIKIWSRTRKDIFEHLIK